MPPVILIRPAARRPVTPSRPLRRPSPADRLRTLAERVVRFGLRGTPETIAAEREAMRDEALSLAREIDAQALAARALATSLSP